MKRLLSAAVVLTTVACLASNTWCDFEETMESRFAVHSHGIKIGDITFRTTTIPGNGKEKSFRISSATRIKANMLFKSYSLESREEAVVGKHGTARYAKEGKENGVSTKVEGYLDNNEFHVTVTLNKSVKSLVIPRNSYDFTSVDCPESQMKRAGQKMSLRLLDLETLKVVNRRYSWVRAEELTINGKTFHCMVIDFEDNNKKCRSWITHDNNGVMIARQEGSGKAGSYSVRLVEQISK